MVRVAQAAPRKCGVLPGLTFCETMRVGNVQPLEVAVVEVQSHGSFRRLGVAIVVVATLALGGAFIPAETITAGVFAIISLVLGVGCLIRDPGRNLPALAGALLSSAAVSAAVIMAFVYA